MIECKHCGWGTHKMGCPTKNEELGTEKTEENGYCEECGWFFGQHAENCSKNPKWMTCIICGDKVERHNSNILVCRDKNHYYKCNDCGKLIQIKTIADISPKKKVWTELIETMRIISNDKDKCIVEFDGKRCPDCHKKYQQSDEYKEYINNKTHNCDHCGGGKHKKGCPTLNEKLGTEKTEENGYCKECGWFFGQHAENCKSDPRLITCAICGETTKKHHANSIICNSKEHYYECQDCKKLIKFNRAQHLSRYKEQLKEFLENVTIISNNGEKCIVKIEGKRCPDCEKEYKKTDEYKQERYEKWEKSYKETHDGLTMSEFLLSDKGREQIDNAVAASHTDKAERKRQETNLKKFGVPNYAQTQKHRDSVHARAGTQAAKDAYKKGVETLLKNHGVTSNYFMEGHADKMIAASQTPEALKKKEKTMLERHGVTNFIEIPEHQEKMTAAAAKVNHSTMRSKVNNEIAERLREAGLEVEQEVNIHGNWIDFKCTNPKTGQSIFVDYNPAISHNQDVNFAYVIWKDESKKSKPNRPKNYHVDRAKLIREEGSELINWFSYYDRRKMTRFIANKCGIFKHEVNAKNCEIKKLKLNDEIVQEFLLYNQIQLWPQKGNIIYGLFNDEELVYLLCVRKGTKRNYSKANSGLTKSSLEILWICSKLNTKIISGLKILIDNLITDYSPDSIVAVAPHDLGEWEEYNALGFTESGIQVPNHYWVSLNRNSTLIPVNKLKDADDYLKDNVRNYIKVGENEKDFIERGGLEKYGKFPLTKEEIMLANRFARLYDAGDKFFVWTK